MFIRRPEEGTSERSRCSCVQIHTESNIEKCFLVFQSTQLSVCEAQSDVYSPGEVHFNTLLLLRLLLFNDRLRTAGGKQFLEITHKQNAHHNLTPKLKVLP